MRANYSLKLVIATQLYFGILILGEDFSKFVLAVSMRSGFPKINREELDEYKLALPLKHNQLALPVQ